MSDLQELLSFFIYLLYIGASNNVLLTCCTRGTNENRKRMFFWLKVILSQVTHILSYGMHLVV